MSNRVMNFSAGPATLPLPALERAQRELLDFDGTGMSVMEQSHRGKAYDAVHEEALALLRELLRVPATYDILFMQGGASQQFAMVPMNFLHKGTCADYAVNGYFGEKALAEAAIVAGMNDAKVHVAASTGVGEKPVTYVRAPQQADLVLDADASYAHFTSNETIHGIEIAAGPGEAYPDFGAVPAVCDMSSDFMSKPIDVSKFALIYAGAQKNVGPSGLVLVIAKNEFLAGARRHIPRIFQYRVFAEANSLINTPATFSIYLVRNVLAWLKEAGGLEAAEKRNREKAALLYGAINDNAGFYRCPVDPSSRSIMNVVFRLPTEEMEEKLVRDAKDAGFVGIKGHRAVGGMRVSLYNAVPVEWAKALSDFLREFARKNG